MADENCDKNKESKAELKRLFVGGLYNGVSKQDLRMKFEQFGNVKDLEFVFREDDAGVAFKTFAYIDIDMSEKRFKQCLSTYNNCSWRGGTLKVQIAKEHYLSRLHKERAAEKKNNSNAVPMSNSAPADVKSAVPGTLVGEKRNWVIGKFGRALPIVFLRRKDSKKVIKYDPSKTVHCLKRIRDDGNNYCPSVENLTWNIDYHCDNKSDFTFTKKARSESNNDNKKISVQKEGKGVEETSFKDLDFFKGDDFGEQKGQRFSSSSTVVSSDTRSPSSSDDNICSTVVRSDTRSPSSSDDNICSTVVRSNKRSPSSSDDNSCSTVVRSDTRSPSSSDDNSYSLRCSTENANKMSLKADTSEIKEDSNHALDSTTNVTKVGESGDAQNSVDHEKTIFNSNVKELDCFYRSPKHKDYLCGLDSRTVDDGNLNEELTLKANKSNVRKTDISNKVRLESLKERSEIIQQQKDIVKTALQNIDATYSRTGNHMVLDEHIEEFKPTQDRNEKITGSKALSWLGMDSSSDENDDGVDKVDEVFRWKKQFDGKSGEKLMELQRKFGHDRRFEMDERFRESDDDLTTNDKTKNSVTVDETDDDEIDQQLKKEKQLSLRVLHDLLGSKSVLISENEDTRNQYRDSLSIRYDPSREDHVKFEEDLKISTSQQLNERKPVTEKTTEKEEPVVMKSKFYEVSDSLKNIFGTKNDEPEVFSFFPDFQETKVAEVSVAVEQVNTPLWKSRLTRPLLPYDSSDSESESESEEFPAIANTKNTLNNPVQHQKINFFYNFDDKNIVRKLREESSTFMRKESIETINNHWIEVRRNLTLDYKRKRKDALRRQKKTAHKK